MGLERVAMLLFGIPDIRLFWSIDKRFLSQFKEGQISKFVPFSKHPPCYKDVAFWLKTSSSAAGGSGPTSQFHENDMTEIVRDVARDLAEDVRIVSWHIGFGIASFWLTLARWTNSCIPRLAESRFASGSTTDRWRGLLPTKKLMICTRQYARN